MDNKDFAVFILTHGRPDNVITYKTLRRQGYTGRIYIIIDNEDIMADRYFENFGDQVIVFDKREISKTFDEADNFNDRRAIVYARNACFGIAKDLGIVYFIQLDDDYSEFKFRINDKLNHPINKFTVRTTLNKIFATIFNYYKEIPAKSIATLQGGDYFAGKDNFGKFKRKCMNVFFCSTDKPFQFVGRINEDVNTYTYQASKGLLFFSIPFIQVDQMQTQANYGGMTELYLDSGTYIKSFYTVLFSPSCAHINLMGRKNQRLHHSIAWNNAVPKIISEENRAYA